MGVSLIDECRAMWPDGEWTLDSESKCRADNLGLRVNDNTTAPYMVRSAVDMRSIGFGATLAEAAAAQLEYVRERSRGPMDTQKAMDFLLDIEAGRVKLTTETQPEDVYAGVVEYKASNGWKIFIFNDCDEWDYVDEVCGDGEVWEFPAEGDLDAVAEYQPSAEVASRCYGFDCDGQWDGCSAPLRAWSGFGGGT